MGLFHHFSYIDLQEKNKLMSIYHVFQSARLTLTRSRWCFGRQVRDRQEKFWEEQTGRPVTRISALRRFWFSNLCLIFLTHLGDTSRTAFCRTKTRLCSLAVICARKEEKKIFNLAVGAHSLPASTSAPLRPSTLLWYASAYSHVIRRSNANAILNLPIFSLRRGQ